FGDPSAPLRFVAEGGEYAAGEIAARERAKLPTDALAAVQQLLLWFPEDTRLYWLLGELLNADGQVIEAAGILDRCAYARNHPDPELKAHRRELTMSAKQLREASVALQEERVHADALKEHHRQLQAKPGPWFDLQKVIVVGGAAGVVVVLL